MSDEPKEQHVFWVDNGRKPSKKLFKQFSEDGIYDLDEWRRTFVELSDPTEYLAAIQLLGSWAEWQRMKHDWKGFREQIIPEWLAEVEVKLRSQSIKHVISKSENDSNAARWLAEGKYKEKRAPGKPSAAEVERAAKIEAGIDKAIDDDIRRVMGE